MYINDNNTIIYSLNYVNKIISTVIENTTNLNDTILFKNLDLKI